MTTVSSQSSRVSRNHDPRLPNPDLFAEKLLERLNVNKPPVPLSMLVSIWKDLSVVEEELDGAGYLLPLGRLGAEIIVNKNDADERKKFTVAHELGHWVLGLALQKKRGEFRQPHGVTRAALEKWCDTFAASILMPPSLVVAGLPPRDSPFLVDGILDASRKFGVSREAFYIRVWDLLKIQVAMLKLGIPVAVRRNYSDEGGERELLKLLGAPVVREQLESTSPAIAFALRNPSGRIFISGRRAARDITLCVAWPS
jgi:Zn-dependent peptidase ImmA (M78 family)